MALIRTILVFCVVSAMVLCISWQETRVRYEGRRLQELGAMLENRTAEKQKLQAQVARLTSPQRIMRIVNTHDMGLSPPRAAPALTERRMASVDNMDMRGGGGESQEVENRDAGR